MQMYIFQNRQLSVEVSQNTRAKWETKPAQQLLTNKQITDRFWHIWTVGTADFQN